jgi:hypothetical protein
MENLQDIIRDFGLVPLCQHIANEGPGSITERDFVDAVSSYAKVATRESKASAFTRLYCTDETGALLRNTVQMLRHHEMHRSESSHSTNALDELTAIAAKLRKREPGLTDAQAFSKIYQDPANRALAQRELVERWQ